jgi:AbiV family abortive infection protein
MKAKKKPSEPISWIDCYFLDGASLSYGNAQTHFKYSEIAANSKDYGFAVSHVVLGIEELIKAFLLICLNGTAHFIDDEQKMRMFRQHDFKHINIKDFLSALTEDALGEYAYNAIDYVTLEDSTKFRRVAYWLSKSFQLGQICENDIDELTAIINKANFYKNKGFYVGVNKFGSFEPPEDIKEETYLEFKKVSNVLTQFIMPVFEMPLSDNRIWDFLDESNWGYF